MCGQPVDSHDGPFSSIFQASGVKGWPEKGLIYCRGQEEELFLLHGHSSIPALTICGPYFSPRTKGWGVTAFEGPISESVKVLAVLSLGVVFALMMAAIQYTVLTFLVILIFFFYTLQQFETKHGKKGVFRLF
jgi:hypothetical protein